MDEEALNTSIRKFLRTVGVSSQREIEQAIARAVQEDALGGQHALPVAMMLEIPALKVQARVEGELKLQ